MYVLHHVPAHVQVQRNILYSVTHAQQVQHIAGESVGIAYLTIGEGNGRVPHTAALLAAKTLYLQRQIAWLAAERKVVQNAPDRAVFDDMTTSAMRTDTSLRRDCFEVKENSITFVLRTGIREALNSIGLV